MALTYALPEAMVHPVQRVLLAERIRIAQELHDTLLQGFLSASMQLNVAVDRLRMDSPAKPRLRRVLQLMTQVIEEGRNAVQHLRSSSGGNLDLEHAFSEINQELGFGQEIAFRVIVEHLFFYRFSLCADRLFLLLVLVDIREKFCMLVRTGDRQRRAQLRDEVYRIGREALVNAFRHAGAMNIEVELEYTPRHLRVVVRDDGRGIDPRVLRSELDKHWGLLGMRERSERIGAKLRIWSRHAAGTEVELSVPGRIAFDRGKSRPSV